MRELVVLLVLACAVAACSQYHDPKTSEPATEPEPLAPPVPPHEP